MKFPYNRSRIRRTLALCGAVAQCTAYAASLECLSSRQADSAHTAGTGGDSYLPVSSPDGRYVLFASTAANLAVTADGLPFKAAAPGIINVYLRDRAENKTVLASQDADAAGLANADCLPVALSTNGLFGLMEGAASNLVPGDTNSASDVFIRDLAKGETVLVSVATNGAAGNGASYNAVMTPDARYVAFTSDANNLVPGDTNGLPDIFIRDLQQGSTIVVSTDIALLPGCTNLGVDLARVSHDGKKVAFEVNGRSSTASTMELNVRDLESGKTYWVSKEARAALGLSASQGISAFAHVFSDDGRFLAFEAVSYGTSSSPGAVLRFDFDSGGTEIIHKNAAVLNRAAADLQTVDISADGQLVAFLANTNYTSGDTCVLLWHASSGLSVASANITNGVSGGAKCQAVTLDREGRWVSFLSTASDLVTNALTKGYHFFQRDLTTSGTTLLDFDESGQGWPLTSLTVPTLDVGGRYVVFECIRRELTGDDYLHVFVIDRQSRTWELVSERPIGLVSASAHGLQLPASGLSADGRLLVFASDAIDLVAEDANGSRDVFVYNLSLKTNLLISHTPDGKSASGASLEPVVSQNGRFVAFASVATNLVAADTNSIVDVYLRDLQTGQTILASVGYNGAAANSNSTPVSISSDGRYLLFRSFAQNLVPGSIAGENFFIRDLQQGTNFVLTSSTAGSPIFGADLTPDGQFAVCSHGVYVSVWDTQLQRIVLSNALVSYSPQVAISPGGSHIAWLTNSAGACSSVIQNVPSGERIVLAGTSDPNVHLRFSGDGQWLAYSSQVQGTNQVYLWNIAHGTNVLVSRNASEAMPAAGDSDSPEPGADGRFVVYRSFAGDLVAGDTNGKPDVFFFDRATATTLLLSCNSDGFPANGWSGSPCMSADGQTITFWSWASNLTPLDFNQKPDLFSYKISASGSSFYIQAISSVSGPTLIWPATPGKSYRVEFKDDLPQSWRAAQGGINIQGTQASYTESNLQPQRFYRVIEE